MGSARSRRVDANRKGFVAEAALEVTVIMDEHGAGVDAAGSSSYLMPLCVFAALEHLISWKWVSHGVWCSARPLSCGRRLKSCEPRIFDDSASVTHAWFYRGSICQISTYPVAVGLDQLTTIICWGQGETKKPPQPYTIFISINTL